jgi:hypothetical protein
VNSNIWSQETLEQITDLALQPYHHKSCEYKFRNSTIANKNKCGDCWFFEYEYMLRIYTQIVCYQIAYGFGFDDSLYYHKQ